MKANVVSSPRIKWIQEVREKSVDFMTACYDLIEYIKFNEEDKRKIIDLRSRVKKNGTLLILYFGPDTNSHNKENNEFIVFLVHLLIIKLVDQSKYYEKELLIKMSDEVRVLEDFLRIYLKVEWKRANGDIKEKDMEKYFDNNYIYNRIRQIYSTGFKIEKEWIDMFYKTLENEFKES